MKKIFIGMPVLNNLEYTKKAIESIKTEYDYELLVMDNCSTDDTFNWCMQNNIDVYKYVTQVPLSEVWNFIITKGRDARCDYIFIPNNDVIFHSKTIDNLVKALDTSELILVTGSNEAPNSASVEELINKEASDNEDYMKPIIDWREEGPDFSCFMIRKDFVDKMGWFDEGYYPAFYEDNDMHYRILLAGYHTKRIFSAPYYHYGSMTVRNNPNLNLSSGQARAYFIHKWGAMPSECMDGKGYKNPYNDSSKDFTYWEGSYKYKE